MDLNSEVSFDFKHNKYKRESKLIMKIKVKCNNRYITVSKGLVLKADKPYLNIIENNSNINCIEKDIALRIIHSTLNYIYDIVNNEYISKVQSNYKFTIEDFPEYKEAEDFFINFLGSFFTTNNKFRVNDIEYILEIITDMLYRGDISIVKTKRRKRHTKHEVFSKKVTDTNKNTLMNLTKNKLIKHKSLDINNIPLDLVEYLHYNKLLTDLIVPKNITFKRYFRTNT